MIFMKRMISIVVLGLFVISMLSFSLGVPSLPGLPGEDVETEVEEDPANEAEQLQEDIDDIQGVIPIDPATGEFDVSAVENIKLKSQERIDKINAWMDENMSWMHFLFRMNPAISWLFLVNVYITLFFLTALVFNAPDFFFYLTNKAGIYFSGIALFAILSVTSVYLYIAKFIVNLFDLIINVVIPYGIIAFVVAAVILGIAAFFFPQLALLLARIPAMIFKGNEMKKTVKAGEEQVKKLQEQQEIAQSFNEGSGI